MKKLLLIGCLVFTTSCQTATPTPEPIPPPTVTISASPSPVPASETPAPTPTLEPTSTPLPRYFTTSFDSSLAGWVTLQGGNTAVPKVSVENNTLRLQMDSPYTWLYALYTPFDYGDVHIETEFINNALTPASAGLICRYSETDGWLEYNVSSDGTYNVLYGRWLSVGIADYLPVIDGLSREVKQSGEIQQIGMTCADTILRLYINGTIVRTVDVSSYELGEGKAGVTAASYESVPVIVAFNSVTISESVSP